MSQRFGYKTSYIYIFRSDTAIVRSKNSGYSCTKRFLELKCTTEIGSESNLIPTQAICKSSLFQLDKPSTSLIHFDTNKLTRYVERLISSYCDVIGSVLKQLKLKSYQTTGQSSNHVMPFEKSTVTCVVCVRATLHNH